MSTAIMDASAFAEDDIGFRARADHMNLLVACDGDQFVRLLFADDELHHHRERLRQREKALLANHAVPPKTRDREERGTAVYAHGFRLFEQPLEEQRVVLVVTACLVNVEPERDGV